MSKRISLERIAKTNAKKARIEEDEEEDEVEVQEIGSRTMYADLSMLETLPDEVAEKIIEFLAIKDIMQLSVVSQRLKNFIAGSFEARKKLVFRFPKRKNEIYNLEDWKESAGQRNYTRVVFEDSLYGQILMKALYPLEKFGIYVKEMKFIRYSTQPMMSKLLNVCPNVEKISVHQLLRNDWRLHTKHPEIVFESIKESYPRLNEIKLPGNSSLLDLFLKCQVKHFEVNGHIYDGIANTRIKFFLMRQQRLETLTLNALGIHLFRDEFKSNALTKVPFQLKKLILQGISMHLQDYDNFLVFINCHRDTLEYLDISGLYNYANNCDILSLFSEFRALESVDILNYIVSDFVVMEHIEKMKANTVRASGDQKFEEKFPNLKELDLHNTQFTPFMIDGITKLEHLEKLTLNWLWIDTAAILNVKTLVLKRCNFTANTKLVAANKSISHLYLTECTNISFWLTELLNHPDTRLEVLSICKMKLSTGCREAINKNAYKNKKFSMVDVDNPM